MQQPHGPRQINLAAPDHDPLAAHAAKRGQIVLGGEAAAIDDEVGASRHLAVAEAQRHAFRLAPHRAGSASAASGREMRLLGIIERAGEAVGEGRLERGKLCRRQAPVPARHAGEAVELGTVAVKRDDQRAVGDGAGIGLAPQRDAALARGPGSTASALSSSQRGASMAPA